VKPSGTFRSGPVALHEAALLTDLYELTMAASYFSERMDRRATFSLFVRQLPPTRSFLVSAGLEDALRFLTDVCFTSEAITYLRELERFDSEFLDFLATLRFTGDVRAIAEGTVVFGNEPLLEISGPIIEAQLVETAILNLCHFQTVVASKAARTVIAARGRDVVEFGLRRAPGLDGGMKAARSSILAGARTTSNTLAALTYGLPPSGTMAHSYVTTFPHEIDAFRAYVRAFPETAILLIDTYDTIAAAQKAVTVGKEMEARGERLVGVRLDSGDIVALSKAVRAIFDAAGLSYVQIFVSGGLDELQIEDFLARGAPINAFGVGTRLDVSADAPYLDMAYKLVMYDGRPVLKTSEGKKTWPGEKQVWRVRNADGRFDHDVIGLAAEPAPRQGAQPLLTPVMARGRMLSQPPSLAAIRERCAAQIAALPDPVRRLRGAAPYAVRYSDRLIALQRETEALPH